MTNKTQTLWLLRIYGPCSMLTLVEKSRVPREAVVGAMTRLRRLGLADKDKNAPSYEITDRGRRYLDELAAQTKLEA